MLKQNLRVFLLFILVVIFLILFKNGQIFDVGILFRSWFGPKGSVNQLYDQPSDLEEDYKNLLVENNQLKTLAKENQELRELLALKEKENYTLAIADILGRDPVNRNILIIDIGKNKNVELGQAVVVNNGIIVGKVIDVGQDSSKVRLLTDSFSKLAVKVGDQQNISGILTGSLGLVMDLSYIPQEQEIKKGDLVVSADIDAKIPSGLVIGKVEEVEFSQEELFKNASISPLINYDNLSMLAIITSL
ncbi:rod shape-determining protein MreC [Patescibacteria group bacterium]|nr:rod shape-determining protein MreC [Patescibacteria group bacterium]